ncbi:MAG: MFS transporter [Pseudomonadota bacterium]
MGQYALMKTRRFLPLFMTQFLGSFNDNMFRSALAVMITYQFTSGPISWLTAGVMVALCSTLLVIPFPILSPIAGQLADKYDKAQLIKWIKLSEVLIMSLAAYGFIHGEIYLLMALLLMTGVHSAFFGPIKYSILSDHLTEKELLPGNSLIAGGTYASVLAGLILGGLLVEHDKGGELIGYVLVGGAILGFIASRFILPTQPASAELKINYHVVREAITIIGQVRTNRPVILSILGLSWFLLIAAVFMGQFPTFAKAVGGDNEVYTLFLVIFSLGISLGSLICNRILKGEISAKYTPVAAFFISLFIIAMVISAPAPTDHLMGAWEFIEHSKHWPMMLSMLGIAVAGGVYIVPLYTIMQAKAEVKSRSRIIAARNVINSAFITLAMLISAGLLAIGLDVFALSIIIALLNLGVVARSCKLLPELPNKTVAAIRGMRG